MLKPLCSISIFRIHMKIKVVLFILCPVCDNFFFLRFGHVQHIFFGLHFGLLRCYANVGKVRNARKAFRVARRATDIQHCERKRKEER